MRIFWNAWFARFMRREGLAPTALKEAIDRAEQGLIDADLGAGVIKQRIARPGEGRSGGYRCLVIHRRGGRAIFVYGFPKSARSSINSHEEEQFKRAARVLLTLTDAQMQQLTERGDLEEWQADDQTLP